MTTWYARNPIFDSLSYNRYIISDYLLVLTFFDNTIKYSETHEMKFKIQFKYQEMV